MEDGTRVNLNDGSHNKGNIAILGIGTALPPHRISQEQATASIVEALGPGSDSARWAKRIFRQCGVEMRYTVEPDLLLSGADCRYLPSSSEGIHDNTPTTAERMALYKSESVPLALSAALEALSDSNIDKAHITHLITVSCTGQFLPGVDAALVKQLGLSPRTERIPLTFLGCAAGLKAIQLAKQIAQGSSNANILIVCVELCTLHLQSSDSREALFGASFFGDGASACVIGTNEGGIFRLGKVQSSLLPDSSDEMVWEIGNYGFDLYLSPNIPKLLGQYLAPEIQLLYQNGVLPSLWAIHPGGRGIVDAVQQQLQLSDEQVGVSRSVLRDIGNVSSATILFVLQGIHREHQQRLSAEDGIAIAFGPGLTAELIQFIHLPSLLVGEEQGAHHVHL